MPEGRGEVAEGHLALAESLPAAAEVVVQQGIVATGGDRLLEERGGALVVPGAHRGAGGQAQVLGRREGRRQAAGDSGAPGVPFAPTLGVGFVLGGGQGGLDGASGRLRIARVELEGGGQGLEGFLRPVEAMGQVGAGQPQDPGAAVDGQRLLEAGVGVGVATARGRRPGQQLVESGARRAGDRGRILGFQGVERARRLAGQ